VHHHVHELVEGGLVRLDESGRATRCYVHPNATEVDETFSDPVTFDVSHGTDRATRGSARSADLARDQVRREPDDGQEGHEQCPGTAGKLVLVCVKPRPACPPEPERAESKEPARNEDEGPAGLQEVEGRNEEHSQRCEPPKQEGARRRFASALHEQ